MIVECKSCHTRFRVADDKITARGIKVRCSKCQHTFMVRKDEGSQEPPVAPVEAVTKVSKLPAPAQPPRTVQMYSISPADIRTSAQAASFDLDGGVVTDPFSVPDTEMSRRRGFDDAGVPPTNPLGPIGIGGPDLTGGQPLATAPAAQETRRLSVAASAADPFAAREDLFGASADFEHDRTETEPLPDDLPAPAAAAGFADPFGETAVAPPPALPAASGPDPFSMPPSAHAPAAPAATATTEPDPFASLGAPPAPPGNGGGVDPFAPLVAAAPAVPFSPPPGPGAAADPLAVPAGASPLQGSAEDIFGGLGVASPAPGGLPWEAGAATDSFHNPLDAETRVRTVDDDMLRMLANYSQAEQPRDEPRVEPSPAAAPRAVAAAVADAADAGVGKGHPLLWHLAQGLLGLVLAGGVLLGVFHFRGGRFQDLTPAHLLSVVLFGEQAFADARLQTAELDVSTYPLAADRVVVVTGQVRNRGSDPLPGVIVRGVLRDADGQDVGTGEVYAGAVVDPFELARARSARRVAARIQDKVARAGAALESGRSWPFSLVIEPQPAADLTRTVVALELRAADAPRAAAPGSLEPQADAVEEAAGADADPALPPTAGQGAAATAEVPATASPSSAGTKPAARPEAKPVAKPVVKPEPAAKPAAKPVARPPRKPAAATDEDAPPPPPPPPPPPG